MKKTTVLAFDLRRKGLTVPYTDVMIAACALRSNACLVHADLHFDRIAAIFNLKAESYVEAVGEWQYGGAQ